MCQEGKIECFKTTYWRFLDYKYVVPTKEMDINGCKWV